MADPSLGSTVLTKKKKTNVKKCIICQQSKKKNETNLTSTVDGVNKIVEASNTLQDGLLDDLTDDERKNLVYHGRNCYAPYVLKGSRQSNANVEHDNESEPSNLTCMEERDSDTSPRTTRSISLTSPGGKSKVLCIICNHAKHKEDTRLYRMSEHPRASNFLAAYKFNKDDVSRRCIFQNSTQDIYAADVMYHTNCMSAYLIKFERDISKINDICNEFDPESEDLFTSAVDELCLSLELSTKGYTLSECRDLINSKFAKSGEKVLITNRHLKDRLQKKFGLAIGFSSAYQKSESEMFFSTNIDKGELVKKIRTTNIVSECAKMLRNESKRYDFLLDSSYCDGNDISVSHELFIRNRPSLWDEFSHVLLDKSTLSDEKQRVCDTVFQMLHKAIHNNQRRTPLSIGFAEAITYLGRSKHLLTLGCRLGFNVSYDEVERVDTSIVGRTIDLVGENRVPVPPHIDGESIIHGATDNFDHNDTHDSILILFQNQQDDIRQLENTISQRPGSTASRERKLPCALPCQSLINVQRGHKRGYIPSNYASTLQTLTESAELSDFDVWYFVRYICKETIAKLIPSFSAINSLLSDEVITETSIGFTPILPYPITEFESVYTVMINFQDVLKQKNQTCGALWCDEGVYQFAKEIQLLYSEQFDNLFIGLGGFHTEKIILACCGKLLNDIGTRDVFVQNEIYGPTVTDSKIMKGKDYVLCREAMRNLTEAVNRVKIDKFFEGKDDQILTLKNLVQDLAVTVNITDDPPNDQKDHERAFKEKWGKIKSHMRDKIFDEYHAFKKAVEVKSEIWQFWNIFTDQVMPVLINLTRSFREGDWLLHLQAIRKALPLFFNCNRTNYCRWTPIYFEDCLKLETKHPVLYQSFCDGNFVVHHTKRRGSGMPMDQALEKEYNKKAKGPGGVIGITRQEESVAKWNLMRHEKSSFTKFIDDLCDLSHSDEYSLHHEFSETLTKNDHKDVQDMKEFLSTRCDLTKVGKLSNMITGIQLSDETSQYLLNCFETGERLYQEYRQTRLVERSKGLFDTIHKVNIKKKKSVKETKPDLKKVKDRFTRLIEVARTRCYNVRTLMTNELTDKPYFLSPDGHYLSKGKKSDLLTSLKTRNVNTSEVSKDMHKDNSIVIFDFMAEARKIESRRKKFNLKTFGDAMLNIWNSFLNIGRNVNRIDIVFDCYRKDTIKGLERKRRSESVDATRASISNVNQSLPLASEFKRFWSLPENKIGLQQFFISWLVETYDGDKTIYLGGCHSDDIDKCYKLKNNVLIDVPNLKCSYDEADDRIMFHLNHAVKTESIAFAHVAAGDTDIRVCLMYHYLNWRACGLQEIWMHHIGVATPLHESVANLPDEVVRILPAIHALTGCDTTSKIGTKLQAFNAAQKSEHFKLETFGVKPLDDDMFQSAEKFLLDSMSRNANRKCDSFDQLRYDQYHASGSSLSIDKIPCTSNSLRKQTQWAYYQCYLWIGAATGFSSELNPIDYAYALYEDGFLYPLLSIEQSQPQDFPHPCTCLKCARETVCGCRVLKIQCCEFCKCKSNCRNPYNK